LSKQLENYPPRRPIFFYHRPGEIDPKTQNSEGADLNSKVALNTDNYCFKINLKLEHLLFLLFDISLGFHRLRVVHCIVPTLVVKEVVELLHIRVY